MATGEDPSSAFGGAGGMGGPGTYAGEAPGNDMGSDKDEEPENKKSWMSRFMAAKAFGVPTLVAAGIATFGTNELTPEQQAEVEAIVNSPNFAGGADYNPGNDSELPNDVAESVTEETGDEEPSLQDVIMEAIQAQTGMAGEQWDTAKPFWEEMFSEGNIDQMMGAQDQGYDALSYLFGEATTKSPFEEGLEDYGMNTMDLINNIIAGDYEMPLAMQNRMADEQSVLFENLSRRGADPYLSTPGIQSRSAFERNWDEKEQNFGLGLLGTLAGVPMSTYGTLSGTNTSQLNTLFGGTQSLLSPMYGGAGSLTAAASGNIQGAAGSAQGLLNSQNWMKANRPDEPSFWEDLMMGVGDAADIYLKWQMANNL